ncbi:MAG TPA: gliding motility-associated C-terminal domain-containing protein, partial [Ohtaekwangia sp.]
MKKPFSIKSIAITAILLTMTYVHAVGQQVPKVSVRGRGYLECLPPDYATSGSKLYPCIIFLHGSGERGNGTTEINKVTAWGTPKFIKNGAKMCFTVNGVEECFIVLSPQQTTNRFGWGVDVIPYVKDMLAAYRIDPDRLYITGLSMGGDGSWDTSYDAANTPNLYAALAPVSCKGDYNGAKVTASKKIAVWAFHGDADTTVPVSNGQRPVNGMLSVGANPAPIFTLVAGGNHGGSTWDKVYSPTHTYYNPNMYEWFLTKKRAPTTPTPPTVNAGVDKTIVLPTTSVSVTGTASDPDGTIASTVWAQVSGPGTATIATPAGLTTNLTALVAGTYTFSLTATDNTGMSSTDVMTVQVNLAPPPVPPVANAGADKSITEPTSSVVFNGSGTDSDGTISSYGWTQTSGPNTATLSGAATNTLTASGLIVGSYTFTLTVTDNTALTGSDQVIVTVLAAPPNAPPSANAGADRSITLPTSSVGLTGSGTDSDGTISTYSWAQSSGPSTAVFTPNNAAATTVSTLQEGVYVFALTVTDNRGATGIDQVIVTVLPVPPNTPPLANAGTDITITLPTNTTSLAGSGSDADGTISTYAWVQTSGPNTATIASPSTGPSGLSNLIEGNYVFTLTVTDNRGATGSDQVVVKVLPVPPNQPPSANAGADKNITLPTNTVSVTGIGTDTDGTISTYAWVQQSGPTASTIVSPNAATTQINNLAEGVYTFGLTVTDNRGATGSDLVTITVFPAANIPPAANAGANQSITLPINSVSLTGVGTDSDGTISGYLWEQVSGPAVATFSNATAANTAANNLTVNGIYIFSLTVTDDDGAKTSDQVQITVLPEPPNQPPVALAGNDVTLVLPDNSTNLNGSGTDSDGTITDYQWNFISGPATGTTGPTDQASLSLSGLVEGIYSFQLTVTDNRGATATDEVKVFVNAQNQPPVANAGADKAITLPTNSVALVGSGTDSDGSINSYAWQQVSGPNTATFNNPLIASVTVSGLIQGIYVFSLRVTDDDGDTDTDQVTVTVNPAPPNVPPVANVGPDQEITLPVNSVSVTGSGTDSDGTVSSYAWTQVSGPNTASITPANQPGVTFGNLIAGSYVFRLTVTDNLGSKGQKDINVKVNPQPVNIPPVANAGADKQITLPISTVALTGSGTDTDGTIASYAWQQISGPVPATFSAPAAASTNASDLAEGIYVFRLVVTDDKGVSSFDEVLVTVKPIPYNLPPIANAGGNKILTLPVSSTTLNGGGSDADGTIADYAWIQISGPGTATTSDLTQAVLNVSGLIEGIYLFRLTVTDNQGSTGFDEINIRVQPVPANQPPTADAGVNKVITLPTNSTSFTGGGTDPDGTINSHAWVQMSGPSTAALVDQATSSLTANALQEGTYVFRLTVTDNAGAQGFDEVNVRVNPEPPNSPPTVSAGSDITLTLPTNSTPVNGTASDPDGTISTTTWTQVSGPSTAALAGQATTALTVSGLIQGSYKFRLTVTDNDGASIFDEVIVVVNPAPPNNPPVADAGADKEIIVVPPGSTTLTATASDSDGTISSTLWEQVSGPNTAVLTDENTLTVTLTNLQPGTYVFRFTTTDNNTSTDFDEVTLTVLENQLPTAFGGDDPHQVFLPASSTQLIGGGSDPDGTIEDYTWSFVSGPTTLTVPANQQNVTISGLVAGQYVLNLTVTDNFGETGSEQITVDVSSSNTPPVADAGTDINITLPTTEVSFEGSGTDAEGPIASYLWEQVSGPAATLADETFPQATASNLAEGVYVFSLTVTDNGGESDTDEVTVTVGPAAGNVNPVANAGNDITITLPETIATLQGSATDDDGTIESYAWTQVSGPPATFMDASVAEPTVTQLSVEGSYVFTLTVTDNSGGTDTDDVTVTVLPEVVTDAVFPKVFSPNGDENNDTWTWANLDEYEGCQLTIYTRFGKKVFEMVSYDNSWDGTDNGKPLEAEAYYYIIKCSSGGETTGGVR